MLPNIKICENIWWIFSKNLQVMVTKLPELTQFASPNLSVTFILYGVGVRCDRGRFSVHSPFIEKSKGSNTIAAGKLHLTWTQSAKLPMSGRRRCVVTGREYLLK